MGPIPEEDFNLFIEPYLGLSHLEAIRAALDPGEIVSIKAVSVKPRMAAFPPGLESDSNLKSIYQLIRAISAPLTGLSYAQAEKQKETRSHLIKLLWSFARFAELDGDAGALILDHKTYLSQKIHSGYDRVQSYFDALGAHGLHCEVVPLVEDRWLTPKGALRRQGAREASPPWEMKMTIDETIGGVTAIKALQRYANGLDAAFDKTAFRRFGRADMEIMNKQ
jgi:hypothetical protein